MNSGFIRVIPGGTAWPCQPYEAAALSLLSFMIVWAAMLALLFVGRGRVRTAQVATTR